MCTAMSSITIDQRPEAGETRQKRQRLEEEPFALGQCERHATLWYKDGTIILATRTTMFRVYRGILSQYSSVFRDMFSLAQPDTRTEGEGFDGVAVVCLHDDAKELEHLLYALHDRSYYNHLGPCEFTISASLLRFSSKYDIPILRSQVIANLTTRWPDELSTFDAIVCKGTRSLVLSSDSVALLPLARETGALTLLPAAFYDVLGLFRHFAGIGRKNFNHEVHEIFCEISKDDLIACSLARESLLRTARDVTFKFLDEPCPDACQWKIHCMQEKGRFLASKEWERTFGCFGVSAFLKEIVKDHVKLCSPCMMTLSVSIEEGRRKVWNEFPTFFGLPDWETLRRST